MTYCNDTRRDAAPLGAQLNQGTDAAQHHPASTDAAPNAERVGLVALFGGNCESALYAEHEAFARGDLMEAAEWADTAEHWSNRAIAEVTA